MDWRPAHPARHGHCRGSLSHLGDLGCVTHCGNDALRWTGGSPRWQKGGKNRDLRRVLSGPGRPRIQLAMGIALAKATNVVVARKLMNSRQVGFVNDHGTLSWDVLWTGRGVEERRLRWWCVLFGVCCVLVRFGYRT